MSNNPVTNSVTQYSSAISFRVLPFLKIFWLIFYSSQNKKLKSTAPNSFKDATKTIFIQALSPFQIFLLLCLIVQVTTNEIVPNKIVRTTTLAKFNPLLCSPATRGRSSFLFFCFPDSIVATFSFVFSAESIWVSLLKSFLDRLNKAIGLVFFSFFFCRCFN